ncbi:glycosyltransferase [Microbacterium ulmi]
MLHVVDRTTGGVPVAVRAYIANSPAGFEHHILSPLGGDGLAASVWTGTDAHHHDLGQGAVRRIRAVRRAVRAVSPGVVHAHSSFGGAYARLAFLRRRVVVVHTPHCYSFNRTDTRTSVRRLYRAAEWALGWRTDVVAACSASEAQLASAMRSIRGRVLVLPNVASLAAPPTEPSTPIDRPLRVGMLGRVSRQKDPEEFLRIVGRLRAAGVDVDPMWIGDSETGSSKALSSGGVSMTGWITGQDLVDALSSLDVYIHSAAWEGFPIAVLDAHQLGLPILVRPITAFGRLDPRQTTSADGLTALADAVSSEPEFTAWRAGNRATWSEYLRSNTPAEQQRALSLAWSRTR